MKGKDHLVDLGVDWNIISELILGVLGEKIVD